MSPFHRGLESDDCSTVVPPSGFNGKVVVVVPEEECHENKLWVELSYISKNITKKKGILACKQ